MDKAHITYYSFPLPLIVLLTIQSTCVGCVCAAADICMTHGQST
jgi:hypothetical protein